MPNVTDAGTSGASVHPSSALTQHEIRIIVLCVLLATLIAALDQTIVSTALPTIGRALGDVQQLTWVVTAYLLAATVVTPIYGKLSDLYGRRSTLLIAVSIFVAGSIACALSQNMLMLIIARTFQGLGGGGLISLSQTVIGDVISPKERPRYQAYISGVFVIASLAGPLLGGFIAEHLHWSLIFWINPPIGLLALLPMYSLLRKLPVDRQHHRIDIFGAALLVVATVASTIRTAPRTSRDCGRSWRGRRRRTLFVIRKAAAPSGRLIQKIIDQCRCSAKKPPSTGPAMLASTNTLAK